MNKTFDIDMYTVSISATGDILAEFDTEDEAEQYIREQEVEDAENGLYEDGWYSITGPDGECRRVW